MGAQNTKFDSSVGHLNAEECLHLKKLFNTFNSFTAPVGNKGEKVLVCPYGDFQRHCEMYLDDWLARRVADMLSVKSSKGDELVVPIGHFFNFVSSLLKGSAEEKVETVWNLLVTEAAPNRETIASQEITQYVRSIIESYMKCAEKSNSYKSWSGAQPTSSDTVTEFSDFLLQELLYPKVPLNEIIAKTKPTKTQHTKDELVDCFARSSLLLNLHNSIVSKCFNLDIETHFVKMIPACFKANSALVTDDFTLMDVPKVLFLNSQLPADYRKEWRYLFSTPTHGESFSKLMGLILDKGPTLIVMRDETGRVFGGFADAGWAVGPKFFGGDQCFLFHLEPKFVVYNSTGYNRNFQYLNVQQQTLPNGLGMGGKLEYFGLWIDAEYGKGRSAPTCTTFTCPQLSTEKEFSIHHLEVWGVGPEPMIDENDRDALKKSILDKDPEARAILELVDRGHQSDGLREFRVDQPMQYD